MLTVPGFEVGESIYVGALCSVHRARRADGVPVYLKALRSEHPDPTEIAGLRREFELLRDLDLPGVVRTHGLENHGWLWVMVVEDFGGESLDRLAPRRPWSLVERLSVASAAAAALGQLHARNIIHKDVTPANVVWNPDRGVIKLVDLGLSTMLTREAPAAKSPRDLEGTLSYVSPEQTGRVNRALDYRSDFYSLGATLYELFTGVPPFSSADPMEVIHCHIARRPVEPWERDPRVPRVVSDIVMRLLAKTPEARYQSSYGLQADLGECLARLANGAIEPFELARHDVTERFHVPQELYGRDEQIGALLRAFEEVTAADSRTALALVTGYAGVGKSTLVQELYKPITQRRGHFVAGKFDQLQRLTPYSAFIGALGSLVRQLLGESEAALSTWRQRLLDAVGASGQVVIDLIPEVQMIIGPQPPVAELGPTESQNRFDLVFGAFVRVLAQPSHPLAIFLDDLQWADSASLKLIELLFAAEEPQCLFVIGAYRDHEVGPTHPLRLTLDALARAGVALHPIPLRPLALADTTRLVARAVVRPEAEAEDLARIVAQKTDGNPLFIVELLKALYEDGLLDFDRPSGRWRWDVTRISARGIADNVVDLMVKKLRRLPPATQRAVQLAACVGGCFDLGTLAILLETTEAEAFQRLLPAIQEGFLVATSGLVVADAGDPGSSFVVRDLKFPHDRVQQAAYNLIDEDERKSVHLRVGRLLQRGAREVTAVVDQLNRGQSLITDAAGRSELAQLNLEAGVKARRALAYAAALTYLEAGIACLTEESWEDAYALTLALHKELGFVLYLNGEHDRAEAENKRLLDRARAPLEKAEIYHTLMKQYGVCGRYEDALRATKDALALLGVDLPLGLPPAELQAAMFAELGDVQARLAGRPIASLLAEPEISDPTGKMITELLPAVLPTAFFVSPVLYSFMVFKGIGTSLRFGLSSQLADLFANYGHIVSGVLGQHVAGYELGKLAIALTQRFHRPDGTCRSSFLTANFIAPWSRPYPECQALNQAAYRAGIDGGDLMYAGFSLLWPPFMAFYQGRPLDEIAASIPGPLHFNRKTRNQISIDHLLALDLVVQDLRGELGSQGLDEAGFLAACDANQSGMARCVYYILKAEAAYLDEDPRGALAACTKAETAAIMGNFANAYHALYEALALAALHEHAGAEDQAAGRERLSALSAQWKQWATSCPENFAHLDALVSAEVARVDGKPSEAMDLYEQAITLARAGGFVQHAALGAELAGKAWLARGRSRLASELLSEALHAYRLRGAARKVEALERRYAALLRPAKDRAASSGSSPRIGEGSSPLATDGARLTGLLDLGSVLKVSQAISSEIVLDRLLTKLMQIVLENAGARQGAIVLERNGGLVVEVEAGVGEGGADGAIVGLVRSTPVQSYAGASEEIIRYVARTRASVILGDAAREGDFTESPYVVRRAPKSVLCAALSSHGRLLAVIYLENNLTTGVFTPERLELLRMLSSQIAISIENALLYRDIEERVALRTTELQQRNGELSEAILNLQATQRQLVQSQKMASLGRLTMGIAHEIKNPLNFVNNFARLDVDLAGELEQMMKDEPGTTLADVRDLVADLKLNAAKICEHGTRADDIVKSMLAHGGGGTGERRSVDLNPLVDQFVRLGREGARAKPGSGDIAFERDHDAAVGEVTLVPQELGRVVVNLVDNAIDAVLERLRAAGTGYVPSIRVTTQRRDGAVTLQIRDNGVGIARAHRDRIFEPFFTTKPPGLGTGLGLSLSYDIVVNGHGGQITSESVEDGETTFTVTLPAPPADAGSADSP